jgi:hypothetical protein
MHRLSHLRQAMLLVVTAITSLVVGHAMAEDAVLLVSTVPGYVPGMVVSSDDQLSLPDGASATVLFQSGEMLRLRGPFKGTLKQTQTGAGKSSAALLAEMFRLQGVDATAIGGTRSTGTASPGPSLEDVQVDSQRSGTYCVKPATTVWIARLASNTDVYSLRRRGNSRMLSWPSGAMRMEWPADVPIEDGSQFEIVSNGTARATVTFHAVSSNATSDPAQVANGLLLGCHDQFDNELKEISRTIVGPEIWITTDRGRKPIYHGGEAISLTVVASTDGYLYCVAASDDGNVKPIFPAGAINGASLSGSLPLSIPGPRQPVGLTAAPGIGHIRCWLADRDISSELPHALLGAPSLHLPDQLSGHLDELFASIGGTRVEADVLTIRIE